MTFKLVTNSFFSQAREGEARELPRLKFKLETSEFVFDHITSTLQTIYIEKDKLEIEKIVCRVVCMSCVFPTL